MPLDPSELGQLVAEFMDELEDEYGPDAELVDAVIAVEVSHIDEDDDYCSTVDTRSLSRRNVCAIGITTRALQAMVDPDE